MGAVHIGVGHNDNFVIADFFQLHLAFAHPRAYGGDYGSDFLVGEDFVKAGFFDIDDFSPQRSTA